MILILSSIFLTSFAFIGGHIMQFWQTRPHWKWVEEFLENFAFLGKEYIHNWPNPLALPVAEVCGAAFTTLQPWDCK